MYTATYQTTVTGGSLPANGDPRDEDVLDLAKWIARRHWDMTKLEFDGEVIWTQEDGWIKGDDNGRHN